MQKKLKKEILSYLRKLFRVRTIRVVVASGNVYKVKAIKKAVREMFPWCAIQIEYQAVESGVPEQPIGGHQTFQGAKNRLEAIKKIFPNADLYVSVEAGLVPLCEGHYGNVQACVVERSDGKQGYGQSAGYEVPEQWMQMAVENGMAVVFAKRFGPDNGGTRPLTNNKYGRNDLIKFAFDMAMADYNW